MWRAWGVVLPPVASARARALLPLDLVEQAFADPAQILLALHGVLEQVDAGAGPGFPRPQIAIHLHKAQPGQAGGAADLHQGLLEALEVSQRTAQSVLLLQQGQEFIAADPAIAIAIEPLQQLLRLQRCPGRQQQRQHHGELLAAEAAAAIGIDQPEQIPEQLVGPQTWLLLGPVQKRRPAHGALAAHQPAQGIGLRGGDDPAQGDQHLLHLGRGDHPIAVGVEQREQGGDFLLQRRGRRGDGGCRLRFERRRHGDAGMAGVLSGRLQPFVRNERRRRDSSWGLVALATKRR